jgi:hypothetical protein
MERADIVNAQKTNTRHVKKYVVNKGKVFTSAEFVKHGGSRVIKMGLQNWNGKTVQ